VGNSDQRISPRRQADHVIEFYDSQRTLLQGVGKLLDLSLSGVLVESSARFSVGQSLVARLRRSDNSQLELPVSVIRVSRKGRSIVYGLQFRRS